MSDVKVEIVRKKITFWADGRVDESFIHETRWMPQAAAHQFKKDFPHAVVAITAGEESVVRKDWKKHGFSKVTRPNNHEVGVTRSDYSRNAVIPKTIAHPTRDVLDYSAIINDEIAKL